MMVYADTNYLTRLYLQRPESAVAEDLLSTRLPVLPVTWLTRLELINAFELSVLIGFGVARSNVTRELAAACQRQFRDDLAQGVAMRLVEISPAALAARFEEIALRYSARHGFRAYDILHVASALELGCRNFWSFDKKTSKLAKLEGLKTL